MENYETLSVMGEGTYGVVTKARHRETGQVVAIKKFKFSDDDQQTRNTSLREVRMLKKLQHDNIISLLEVFRRESKLCLVFEFADYTLLNSIERCKHGLKPSDVRRYIYQLLKGLEYCHVNNIIHRDVKPENVLITKGGVIKLCDFGFARQLSPHAGYTDYVATRWYRSPELLVGDVDYGKPVDIWAVGCIFSELSDSQPLFPGESDLDQLAHIMRCTGRLPARLVRIFKHNSLYRNHELPPHTQTRPLSKRFSNAPPDWLEFLEACLHNDPEKRMTCTELMNLPYFTRNGFREKFESQLEEMYAKENRRNPLKQMQLGITPPPLDNKSGKRGGAGKPEAFDGFNKAKEESGNDANSEAFRLPSINNNNNNKGAENNSKGIANTDGGSVTADGQSVNVSLPPSGTQSMYSAQGNEACEDDVQGTHDSAACTEPVGEDEYEDDDDEEGEVEEYEGDEDEEEGDDERDGAPAAGYGDESDMSQHSSATLSYNGYPMGSTSGSLSLQQSLPATTMDAYGVAASKSNPDARNRELEQILANASAADPSKLQTSGVVNGGIPSHGPAGSDVHQNKTVVLPPIPKPPANGMWTSASPGTTPTSDPHTQGNGQSRSSQSTSLESIGAQRAALPSDKNNGVVVNGSAKLETDKAKNQHIPEANGVSPGKPSPTKSGSGSQGMTQLTASEMAESVGPNTDNTKHPQEDMTASCGSDENAAQVKSNSTQDEYEDAVLVAQQSIAEFKRKHEDEVAGRTQRVKEERITRQFERMTETLLKEEAEGRELLQKQEQVEFNMSMSILDSMMSHYQKSPLRKKDSLSVSDDEKRMQRVRELAAAAEQHERELAEAAQERSKAAVAEQRLRVLAAEQRAREESEERAAVAAAAEQQRSKEEAEKRAIAGAQQRAQKEAAQRAAAAAAAVAAAESEQIAREKAISEKQRTEALAAAAAEAAQQQRVQLEKFTKARTELELAEDSERKVLEREEKLLFTMDLQGAAATERKRKEEECVARNRLEEQRRADVERQAVRQRKELIEKETADRRVEGVLQQRAWNEMTQQAAHSLQRCAEAQRDRVRAEEMRIKKFYQSQREIQGSEESSRGSIVFDEETNRRRLVSSINNVLAAQRRREREAVHAQSMPPQGNSSQTSIPATQGRHHSSAEILPRTARKSSQDLDLDAENKMNDGRLGTQSKFPNLTESSSQSQSLPTTATKPANPGKPLSLKAGLFQTATEAAAAKALEYMKQIRKRGDIESPSGSSPTTSPMAPQPTRDSVRASSITGLHGFDPTRAVAAAAAAAAVTANAKSPFVGDAPRRGSQKRTSTNSGVAAEFQASTTGAEGYSRTGSLRTDSMTALANHGQNSLLQVKPHGHNNNNNNNNNDASNNLMYSNSHDTSAEQIDKDASRAYRTSKGTQARAPQDSSEATATTSATRGAATNNKRRYERGSRPPRLSENKNSSEGRERDSSPIVPTRASDAQNFTSPLPGSPGFGRASPLREAGQNRVNVSALAAYGAKQSSLSRNRVSSYLPSLANKSPTPDTSLPAARNSGETSSRVPLANIRKPAAPTVTPHAQNGYSLTPALPPSHAQSKTRTPGVPVYNTRRGDVAGARRQVNYGDIANGGMDGRTPLQHIEQPISAFSNSNLSPSRRPSNSTPLTSGTMEGTPGRVTLSPIRSSVYTQKQGNAEASKRYPYRQRPNQRGLMDIVNLSATGTSVGGSQAPQPARKEVVGGSGAGRTSVANANVPTATSIGTTMDHTPIPGSIPTANSNPRTRSLMYGTPYMSNPAPRRAPPTVRR